MTDFDLARPLVDKPTNAEHIAKEPYRRHSPEFKLQVCGDIRSGRLGRRDAQRKFRLSDNLIQHWLARFDLHVLQAQGREGSTSDALSARIALLERKIGQLTMALDSMIDHTEGQVSR